MVSPMSQEELLQALVQAAFIEAEQLAATLFEAVGCLRNSNHLGALGTLDGTRERMEFVQIVLKWVAQISQTSSRSRSSQPKNPN